MEEPDKKIFEKTAGRCADRRNGADPFTACGGNAVNDKNIADALNDMAKGSLATYTFKSGTDEQAMAKAIAALSESDRHKKGDGGNKFSGPVMKILGLNEGGKNETSRFVWCGAVIADEIGTAGTGL